MDQYIRFLQVLSEHVIQSQKQYALTFNWVNGNIYEMSSFVPTDKYLRGIFEFTMAKERIQPLYLYYF
jgi:hypothetical protein